MNKAFEKISERLEELQNYACFPTEWVDEEQSKIHSYYANKLTEILKLTEQYNNGWIPCSERLPEECTEVLVSVKEIDDSFYTRTSWVQDGVWVIKKTPLQPTVIAWQPLPEPYKERD